MLRRLITVATALGLAATASPTLTAHAAEPVLGNVKAHSPLHRVVPAGANPASPTPVGYIPCDIYAAYQMGTVNANTGAGQTIAIIDPYDAPTAATDFASFSSQFGLPTGNFSKVLVSGANNTDTSWIGEVSLDIEWAHAAAPGAQIVLVQAYTSGGSDMLAAIDYAIGANVNADVVSMSWTFAETQFSGSAAIAGADAHLRSTNAAGKNVMYVASAGDNGHEVNWPAESPLAVGVGGTTVAPAAFGYSSVPASHTTCAGRTGTPGVTSANETVWGSATAGSYGTGGGIATLEAEPAYQSSAGISASGRAIPDIAIDGDPATGVAVFQGGAWQAGPTGGTSLGAPLWAGILARLNAAKGTNSSGVGPTIYGPSYTFFNDITTGSAAPRSGTNSCTLPGAVDSCNAKPGFDYVSGRGSPLVNSLQGVASAQTFKYYFPWFDKVSDPGFKNDNVHVVNPGGVAANVVVHIPGCSDQSAQIGSRNEGIYSCGGGFGGPVVVTSDQPLVATQRVQYYQTFNEVRAIATTSAAQHLAFTWFDLASSPGFTSDNVHVVNPQATATSVTVTIPGCAAQTRSVSAGSYGIFTCPGGFGGPVTVDATAPVIATQRVKYYSSFNEVGAMPAVGTGTNLLLSWFDRISDPGFQNDNIHVMGTAGTSVTVKISNPFSSACPNQTQTIPASGYLIFTCASGFGGPIQVQSSAPVNASQRVQYYQSFNEVAASAPSEAGQQVWLSWFDLASDPGFLSDNVHVINPSSTATAGYSVSIPGCSAQTGSLSPLTEAIVSCPGGFGGPISVAGTTAGVPVLGAARVKYYSSFNEVSGTAS